MRGKIEPKRKLIAGPSCRSEFIPEVVSLVYIHALQDRLERRLSRSAGIMSLFDSGKYSPYFGVLISIPACFVRVSFQ